MLSRLIMLIGAAWFSISAYAIRIYTPDSINLGTYSRENFYSMVWNTEPPHQIYISPSEGAKYADGSLVESEHIVVRLGGHGDLLRKLEADNPDIVEITNWRGGGLIFTEENEMKVFHKSRSVNGHDFGDGEIDPGLRPEIEKRLIDQFKMTIEGRKSGGCFEAIAHLPR
jgi:hypothetical protein